MFCPICRAEYRQGFVECKDCGVPLVDELPELDSDGGEPDLDFETVLESANPALIAVAKSILDGAGIEYVASGVGATELPVIPVRLEVDEKRAEEARALLAELEEEVPPLGDESDDLED